MERERGDSSGDPDSRGTLDICVPKPWHTGAENFRFKRDTVGKAIHESEIPGNSDNKITFLISCVKRQDDSVHVFIQLDRAPIMECKDATRLRVAASRVDVKFQIIEEVVGLGVSQCYHGPS